MDLRGELREELREEQGIACSGRYIELPKPINVPPTSMATAMTAATTTATSLAALAGVSLEIRSVHDVRRVPLEPRASVEPIVVEPRAALEAARVANPAEVGRWAEVAAEQPSVQTTCEVSELPSWDISYVDD